MTVTADTVLDFEKFSLRRHGPDDNWLVEWKTTGLIEYLDTGGKTNQEFIARELADRLEHVVDGLKRNEI
jgi:hypothetical protein